MGVLGGIVTAIATAFVRPLGLAVVARDRVTPSLAFPHAPQPVPPAPAPLPLPLPAVARTARVKPEHVMRRHLKVVSVEKAVDILIAFMNSEGQTGTFSASEIDAYWQWCCEAEDLEPIKCRFIREALDGRGLKLGLIRLLTPEYAAVRQRTGSDRCVLYRIPRCRKVAGIDTELPETKPANPDRSHHASGNDPATIENPNEIREAA